ncbi:hypothetical protein Golob_019937, partial [Gossypium lobatum]|nr:hypothetical protein [Gossypium lobatum]
TRAITIPDDYRQSYHSTTGRDGDVVTLVDDDDDFYDVMRQRLKFLKIDMQLNNDKLSKPCAASSQSFILLRSPSFQPPSEGINTVAADSSMQLVESSGCPCTTIDVSNLDP